MLLIGDSGVGKSSLLLRFVADTFSRMWVGTIGIDFKVKTIQQQDGQRLKMQVWDTAGQERFRTITTAYYRGAMGILLVYDVTDEQSFHNVATWMDQIDQHADRSVNRILLGNKCDLLERVVSTERGQQLAKKYGIPFFETSAKSDFNVTEAFETMAFEVRKRLTREGAAGCTAASTVALHEQSVLSTRRMRTQCPGGCAGATRAGA